MEDHKLNGVFLTVVNDGSHYSRRCDAARRTQADRFATYSNIVSETIRKGHGYMWWNRDDFTMKELFSIVEYLDEYHQNHLAECRGTQK